MAPRAVWHTELVLDESADPFADAPQRIEDVGTPIEIGEEGGEGAELHRALIVALGKENRLDSEGVTCAIKDAADTSCFACPLYQADDSLAAALCKVGREQESICTKLAVLRHGGRRQ